MNNAMFYSYGFLGGKKKDIVFSTNTAVCVQEEQMTTQRLWDAWAAMGLPSSMETAP